MNGSKKLRLEYLEERIALSATPHPNLDSAHGLTNHLNALNKYGFLGEGQTVAVIDSGIAYDHVALGGGFGENYRVVGGWDFTENDADPYDDAPGGYHGTHVAGIVGADSGSPESSGVAPGVDLVALRVFGDNGQGYFSWIESALQWVHDHKDDFENPITVVNISIGEDWNSDGVPYWSTSLEAKLAQLKADGIFISVSAGNSFTTYGVKGLNYPAASPYVVPVMSIDDNGNLSYYSQRLERAIAAPGRWINSTVPDHHGNNDGIPNDWGSSSGTSMAAPYVAGASALVREAMEFAGITDITQDTIYDALYSTATIFYDTVTNTSYHRLNIEAALDFIMPADDYGSTLETAFQLQENNFQGVIGQLDDADFFTFTADTTGIATFSIDSVTHKLNPIINGNSVFEYSFNVVAGQTYSIGLAGTALGYYTGTISIIPIFSGDFDGDGDTDGSDFLKWQVGYGRDASGDANGDGITDGDDLLIWSDNYGDEAIMAAFQQMGSEKQKKEKKGRHNHKHMDLAIEWFDIWKCWD